jgi:hypothetical protein
MEMTTDLLGKRVIIKERQGQGWYEIGRGRVRAVAAHDACSVTFLVELEVNFRGAYGPDLGPRGLFTVTTSYEVAVFVPDPDPVAGEGEHG